MAFLPGYYGSSQNASTSLNNVINSLRSNQAQARQQAGQSTRNPGNNRPRPPRQQRGGGYQVTTPLSPVTPTAVQPYQPQAAAPAAAPGAAPAARPVTGPAQIATPISGPVVRTNVVPGRQPPPVVPATGPYGPVAGIPLVRQYG